jgi:hypothetical protein
MLEELSSVEGRETLLYGLREVRVVQELLDGSPNDLLPIQSAAVRILRQPSLLIRGEVNLHAASVAAGAALK